MSPTVSVQLDALAALGAELTALGAQLAEEPATCRRAGSSLAAALSGDVGERAARVAVGWAALVGLLAARCQVTGRTLQEAATSYAASDAALARELAGAGGPPR